MNKVRVLESTYLFCLKVLSRLVPVLVEKRATKGWHQGMRENSGRC